MGMTQVTGSARAWAAEPGSPAPARSGATRNFARCSTRHPTRSSAWTAPVEITVVNAEAGRIFGYTREEMLGCPGGDAAAGGLRAAHVAHREAFAANPHQRPMGAGLALTATPQGRLRLPRRDQPVGQHRRRGLADRRRHPRRDGVARDRVGAARRRRRRAGRERGQEPFPVADEPRAAHPAERGAGLRAAAERQLQGHRARGGGRPHREGRPASARSHQRRARHRPHRVRRDVHQQRAGPGPRRRRGDRSADAAARRDRRSDAHADAGRRRRLRPGRPPAAAPGPAEPAVQRHQVQPTGRPGVARLARCERQGRPRGARRRPGHRPGRAEPALHPVRPARRRSKRCRRHRDRARPDPLADRDDGRIDRRRIGPGPRDRPSP